MYQIGVDRPLPTDRIVSRESYLPACRINSLEPFYVFILHWNVKDEMAVHEVAQILGRSGLLSRKDVRP